MLYQTAESDEICSSDVRADQELSGFFIKVLVDVVDELILRERLRQLHEAGDRELIIIWFAEENCLKVCFLCELANDAEQTGWLKIVVLMLDHHGWQLFESKDLFRHISQLDHRDEVALSASCVTREPLNGATLMRVVNKDLSHY